MKTIEIVGDEPVVERAKKYRILLKFPAKRETTELPIQERETRSEPAWETAESRWRRRYGW